MTDASTDGIILYQREDGLPGLEVRLESESVWLSQQQLAELFQTTRENIAIHIRNIYDEEELRESATSKDFLQVRQEGRRTVRRRIVHYNLDVIISVGYRVKSKVATQFRIWATEQLRNYIVGGVVVNERRLEQLGQMVQILSRSVDQLVSGVAEIFTGYLPSLRLLRQFDAGDLGIPEGGVPRWELTIEETRRVIGQLQAAFPEDSLFGGERSDNLEGIVQAIYQSFGGNELYPSTQEKAANLLYLVVKDHPLSDGNKRTAATLFVTFLAKNNALLGHDDQPLISNNALAAVTLMVAMSEPKEKDLMIALIVNMLAEDMS
ncbi:MAG: RhuM family protein [Gulosibacter sp.]|uniref:RhuM family protein n=1 Tax=Gulosibacter sp. TaxID=2817531 RepID=UPI003F8EE6BE